MTQGKNVGLDELDALTTMLGAAKWELPGAAEYKNDLSLPSFLSGVFCLSFFLWLFLIVFSLSCSFFELFFLFLIFLWSFLLWVVFLFCLSRCWGCAEVRFTGDCWPEEAKARWSTEWRSVAEGEQDGCFESLILFSL